MSPFQRDGGTEWNRGLGDVAFAFKRTVYASMRTGGIGAAGLEVILPTGKEQLLTVIDRIQITREKSRVVLKADWPPELVQTLVGMIPAR